MKPGFTTRTVFILLITACFTLGCGGGAVEYGPTGTVSGTVKIGDKAPAEGTLVNFMQPTEGYSATGYTDA